MPAATVTVRELKNKDTGIDLSIPTYHEVPGRLGSIFEYDVVVVSRLSYFKLPKHKETDNVQFMIQKKFSEFEDLHSKMTSKFSGTMFPPLPKKVLVVNDTTAKERRGLLEEFLKFMSRTPKLSTSSLLLEFLGVNTIKAGKFRHLKVTEGMDEKEDEEEGSVTKNEEKGEENVKEPDTVSKLNLFDEEQEEETDLFVEGETDRVDMDISLEMKASKVSQSTRGETKLFDDVDLGGGIEAEAENQFQFVLSEKRPINQSKQKTSKPNLFEEEGEDNSDLFQIDDDLDKLLSVDLKSKFAATNKDLPVSNPQNNNLPAYKAHDSPVKVPPVDEPQSPNRPKPAPRTKPSISTKPTSLDSRSQDTEINLTKPDTDTQDTHEISPPKPTPRQKPPVSRKPMREQKPPVPPKPGDKMKIAVAAKEKPDAKGDNTNEITQDDILKYIQDNAADNSDDLDLFS